MNREHRIPIWVSSAELAEIDGAARAAGSERSPWCRRALLDRARGEGAVSRADERIARLEARVAELEGR